MRADIERMKKASSAVYLACDERSVADDISSMFKTSIVEIESLRLQLANAKTALDAASELLAPMGDHYLVSRVRDQVNAALKEMRS